MEFRYLAVRQPAPITGEGCAHTYGICAQRRARGRWVQTALVPDVSPDEAFVQGLARQYTQMQLDPKQLYEALDNALNLRYCGL